MSEQPARIYLDVHRVISEISPLLFGGFAEHMGRCIYEGIYDPASPHADARGFRLDVLEALRELNFTTIRYPGGNFLSGYHWLDGVGPKEKRPTKRDLAWRSIETNQFGLDEFMEYAKELGTRPMLAVNMGTGTIEEAGAMVEYVNAPLGTQYADLRAANGHPEPYGVEVWCVGNEMDGPWQIGHLGAADYGKKAREAAKIMRLHDPRVKLVLCGSSNTIIPTYPEWDRTALEICYEQMDYLSLHYYANNNANDTPSFLAQAYQFEQHLNTLEGTLRYVKAKLRSNKDVFLSWDEWNVWYKNMEMAGNWQQAPHLIEEVFNLEDALVVAQWMNVFLRKSNVLKVACIAQIVNIIAPILTTTDGLLKQSIFYPFMLFSNNARGLALDAAVQAPMLETKQFGGVPALDVSASHDPETGQKCVFIVHRGLAESLPVELVWQSDAPAQVASVTQVAGNDPKAANSFENPQVITAKVVDKGRLEGGVHALTLPPLSFTMVKYG